MVTAGFFTIIVLPTSYVSCHLYETNTTAGGEPLGAVLKIKKSYCLIIKNSRGVMDKVVSE